MQNVLEVKKARTEAKGLKMKSKTKIEVTPVLERLLNANRKTVADTEIYHHTA